MICPNCNLDLPDSEFTKMVFGAKSYSDKCNRCLNNSMQWALVIQAFGEMEFSK